MGAKTLRRIGLAVLGLVFLLGAAGAPRGAEKPGTEVFARVNDVVITGEEYLAMLRGRARRKFYHRKVPEQEMQAFRREVGESLILNALLAREAERRGLQPDQQWVAQGLANFEKRYAASPQWKQNGQQILAQAASRLRADSRIAALEAQVQAIAPPTEVELKAFYREHPDKFTTPEKVGVSAILLQVPASSPAEAWEEARAKAETLAAQIASGADFGKLAKLHSQNPSAGKGGDLGYLHRDMLGQGAQQAIDGLAGGQVSAPVRLLEGYALFRLNGRQPARVNPLKGVRERALGLWTRERKEQKWAAFRKNLRQQGAVVLNEKFYTMPVKLTVSGYVKAEAGGSANGP